MLAVLLETPRTPEQWDRWSFHHRDSHDRIRAAIVAKGGPALPDAQIFPVRTDDFADFLQRNSLLHISFDTVLGTQGSDLQDVDLKDEKQLIAWTWTHYLEHQTAELRLGL